jgi:hypothetical protein
MSLIKPEEQQMLRDKLTEALAIVNSLPIKKSCEGCKHFDFGTCRLAGEPPPEDVQPVGCSAWEWAFVPF